MMADAQNDMSCTGPVLVVGGTRGIGRAVVERLARSGTRVGFTGRTQGSVDRAAEQLAAGGLPSPGFVTDLAASGGERDLVGAVSERLGDIAALVLCAGANPYFKPASRLSVAEWDEMMAVNLRGPFFLAQAFGDQMLAAGRGSVVFLSSVTASRGTLRGLPYVAAKGGLESTARTLAYEWAPTVRVNTVAPGYITTDLTRGLVDSPALSEMVLERTALRRFGNPEEVASIIVFLCSELSSYITGEVIAVDGGYTLK
jgi:NAD(P)-dependent dehydrogenase (short-subunit alcohol dehydrogenase family)